MWRLIIRYNNDVIEAMEIHPDMQSVIVTLQGYANYTTKKFELTHLEDAVMKT